MIIDDIWATIGSTNFDNRSMAMNDELNVIFYEEHIAKELERVFLEDLAHSKTISRDHVENRGWLDRILGIVMRPFHNYF
jgi:cardiolipin synthase